MPKGLDILSAFHNSFLGISIPPGENEAKKLCVKFNEECKKSALKSYKSTKMKFFLENFAKTLVYFQKMSYNI